MKYLLFPLFIFLSSPCSFAQNQKIIIHFPFDNYSLTTSEVKILDSFIRAVPKAALFITGHTDSKGSVPYNDRLSKRRAEAVKNYLTSKSYPSALIKQNSFGESKLIEADDEDEEKGMVNRRVEIVWFIEKATVKAADKTTPDMRSIKEQIEDSTAITGSTLVLQNLNFMGGRHRLLRSSYTQLKSLHTAMKENPKLKISIEGHICCLPGPADGLDFDTNTEDLSFQRAKAISEYLSYMGIDKRRIQFRGFGHSAPLFPYPEQNEEEQTANRRVEIRILEK